MKELREKKSRYLLSYNLQIFADGPGGEKTEEASTKKLGDARKEGQVARSTELLTGATLFTMFLSLKLFIGYMGNRFILVFRKYYEMLNRFTEEEFQMKSFFVLLREGLMDIVIIAIPILLVAYVTTFVTLLVQVKWKVSGKPLKPDLKKINPIQGFKKMFSKDKIVDLLKAVLKIIVIFYLVYNELKDQIGFLNNLYSLSLTVAINMVGDLVINLGLKVSAVFLVIGFADYFYQIKKFKKEMMMTKQEVKDEYKQTEGDPQIKGRIKAKMREVSQRRMMQEIPQADVVITNPTHFAVAIKYDKETSSAPIVVAKGADFVAFKIREIAKEHKIEIVENKPLARMLYFNVDVGSEIPTELYQMVAEVLAYVYKLKNGR